MQACLCSTICEQTVAPTQQAIYFVGYVYLHLILLGKFTIISAPKRRLKEAARILLYYQNPCVIKGPTCHQDLISSA